MFISDFAYDAKAYKGQMFFYHAWTPC